MCVYVLNVMEMWMCAAAIDWWPAAVILTYTRVYATFNCRFVLDWKLVNDTPWIRQQQPAKQCTKKPGELFSNWPTLSELRIANTHCHYYLAYLLYGMHIAAIILTDVVWGLLLCVELQLWYYGETIKWAEFTHTLNIAFAFNWMNWSIAIGNGGSVPSVTPGGCVVTKKIALDRSWESRVCFWW